MTRPRFPEALNASERELQILNLPPSNPKCIDQFSGASEHQTGLSSDCCKDRDPLVSDIPSSQHDPEVMIDSGTSYHASRCAATPSPFADPWFDNPSDSLFGCLSLFQGADPS
ncbi:hypothetical protein NE237_016269 [Protea cynaroides]|uniref:Uncharacterized protein n=1 Tax=Protea cynaroides TaxID=273540 RepID=A0A9Q0QRV7_9MAGN|nr:hypothetical protein NE237_016269 [Protea cynaroides]